MIIVGCDFHPSWQQVAMLDAATGELVERKLVHGNGEAEQFYRSLPIPSLVGVESCGNSQWFMDLLQQLGHEVWGRGCGPDSGQLCAPAEDRSP